MQISASGSRTGFVVRHTAVIQRQDSEAPIRLHFSEEMRRGLPRFGTLCRRLQEMSNASADVVINRFVCPASCSVEEISRPAAQ